MRGELVGHGFGGVHADTAETTTGRAEGDRPPGGAPSADRPPPRPRALTPDELGFTPQPAVRWFDPRVLASAGLRATITGLFGTFLDKRELLVTAPAHPDTRFARHDEGLWIDYVADTGDGFDATYAVASQVAARELHVDGVPTPLPRAQILVLGGDQVYPAASTESYEDRLAGPWRAALPWTVRDHPALFAIPGNHDWYDGLTGFLRLFGQGRWIGGWRTSQGRSYFAVQLPHRWWLWGVDIQFDSFIDTPQLAFFDSVLDRMRRGDRLVLATAVPTWVDLAADPDAHRNLAYIERKLLRPRGIELALTLAGDRHHYSRYSNETAAGDPTVAATRTDLRDAAGGRAERSGTATGDGDAAGSATAIDGVADRRRGPGRRPGPVHKITCGGGGAFLHTTHDLPREVTVTVDPAADEGTATFRRRCVYPDRRRSRRLALGALALPWRNPWFMIVPATLHVVLLWTNQFGIRSLDRDEQSYASSAERSGWYDLALGLVRNPAALTLLLVLFAGLVVFARPPAGLPPRWRPRARLAMGAVHTVVQVAAVVAVALAGIRLASPLTPGVPFTLGASAAVGILGGVASSIVLGAYLVAATLAPGLSTHSNETMSAARVARCRSFLRLHITADGALEVHAIGIDDPPTRWRTDPDNADVEAPWLVPDGRGCDPHLIEKLTIR